jgi:hypothetical protein
MTDPAAGIGNEAGSGSGVGETMAGVVIAEGIIAIGRPGIPYRAASPEGAEINGKD